MHNQAYNQYQRAASDYFSALNRVNLLLLKEHTLTTEQAQYQQQIDQIDNLIRCLTSPLSVNEYAIEAEWQHLQRIISLNKKQIKKLKYKLEQKETIIADGLELMAMQEKYSKILSTDCQTTIKLKLSMIRGKVDDLKKKIKQINKDILSYEQEHKELIDQYSFECQRLATYQANHTLIREEISALKAARRNEKK